MPILGPMFSGKTSALLSAMRRHRIAKRKCLLIKYSQDCRYSDECVVATHDKNMLSADVSASTLSEVGDMWMDYDVVGVDEGQFFPDLAEFCDKFANEGKIVVIACLSGTFQRKMFPQVSELLAISEKPTFLTAVCTHCGNDAPFSFRKVQSDEVELIGSEDLYTPLCRSCFNEAERRQTKRQATKSKAVEHKTYEVNSNGTAVSTTPVKLQMSF
eukprot:TRINITY_DN5690_c0_g2_i1.p1 TRINITY_DN5690_c0_g2~~TRINITY_DN5690_c0_g2_i1.p1  ORF type:complete len:249 (+),score=66.22 TRINITY_DN5690_c0_g2_i1:104-748(+)